MTKDLGGSGAAGVPQPNEGLAVQSLVVSATIQKYLVDEYGQRLAYVRITSRSAIGGEMFDSVWMYGEASEALRAIIEASVTPCLPARAPEGTRGRLDYPVVRG